MSTVVLIFDYKPSTAVPPVVNLEDIRLVMVHSREEELDAATVERLVSERLRVHYDQVLDSAAHRVPARMVADSVMETARENSWCFWKDLRSDIIVGTEVALLLRELKSLKDIEAVLRKKHGWNF